MNILFIATFPIIPHEGGVQRVTDTLSKELLNRGHKIYYLCHARKHKLSYPSFTCPQLYVELHNKSDKELQNELKGIVEQHGITHVVNQTCTMETNRIIRNLPKSLQYKIVYTHHVIPFACECITRKRILEAPARNIRQLIFKWCSVVFPCIYRGFFAKNEKRCLVDAFPLAAKFCLISDKFYNNVTRNIPNAPISKFTAINNPNSFLYQTEIPSYDSRENSILWVGRVEHGGKNLLGFIEVWSEFVKKHKDWKAYVLGKGDALEYFKSYVNKKCIPNISFEGNQNDIMHYYKKCKFLCVTSYSESWGMVLTESMVCGCVPVAFNTFATLTDIIDDGKNGIVCKPDITDMVLRIDKVANNSVLWTNLSKNAVQKAKKFDVSVIASHWETLLKSL